MERSTGEEKEGYSRLKYVYTLKKDYIKKMLFFLYTFSRDIKYR